MHWTKAVPLLALALALPHAPSAAQPAARSITAVPNSGTQLVLREVLSIGSLDGRYDAFGRVMDAAFGRDGRIYVADDQNHRVAAFGPDGRFLRFIGRQGKGPGEFESPWLLAVDGRDSLFVWDAALARVSVFSPDFAFRRSFPVPAEWIVNGIDFLPDGSLLVAAYARGARGGLHVLDRAGRARSAFGPAFPSADLGGFEASLLGGAVDFDAGTIAYSRKSPYEVSFFDAAGRPRSVCRGAEGWTTRPATVVLRSAQGTGLAWNRFVHSTHVHSLGNGFYLNVVRDPVQDRGILDVLTADCRLHRRRVTDTPVVITRRMGSRLLAVRTLDYPEVLVYDFHLRP